VNRKLDWERARELYDQEQTDEAIAQAIGGSPRTVMRWRRRMGLPKHAWLTRTRDQAAEDEREVRERVRAGDSDQAIADALTELRGYHPPLSTKAVSDQRARMELAANLPPSVDRQRFRELWKEGRTTRDIAAELGCTHRTAQELLHRMGLPANRGSSRKQGGSPQSAAASTETP